MIRVAPGIEIDEGELEESFVRASGPGGQNVNKVSTAVDLRFDARGSPSLTASVLARLRVLAGRRMNAEGVVVIEARRFRSQDRNRADARERLIELIRAAATPPKPRRPTRPTLASKTRRLESKERRARTKTMRSAPSGDE